MSTKPDTGLWLTTAEQRTWRAFLEASWLLFAALDHELQHDVGMSHADYEILVHLSEAPERQMRMSKLADVSLFSRSRLSHAVGRLEELGWVRRATCPSDRRGTLALLTEAGYAALEAAAPDHVAAVRRYLFDGLDADQVAQLGTIAAAVRDRIHAVAAAGSCEMPEPDLG